MNIENETFGNFIWESFPKPALDYVDDWALMKSPIPVILIFIVYIIFVLKVGPQYMKNRPAYNLNTFLKFYNIFQIALSLLLFQTASSVLSPLGYVHISCREDEAAMRQIAQAIYIFFLAKVSELIDTTCMVLRKKQRQVTFLHVFHHSLMTIAPWIGLKYEPSYFPIFLGLANSVVHVFMYSYYFLSTYPSLKKYLWWKKYITVMQLVQFVMIIIHAVGNYLYGECPPSLTTFLAITLNSAFFLYLFGSFYIQSYIENYTKVDSNVTQEIKDKNF